MTTATLHAEPTALWSRVLEQVTVTPEGCWMWTGTKNSKGYGSIGSGRKSRTFLVHRLAVIVRDGHIGDGLTVDHTCHNDDPTCPGGVTCRHRVCVNPTHLDPVPIRININRSGHGSETHCGQGHLLSGSNLFIHKHGKRPPTRGCRACRQETYAARPR